MGQDKREIPRQSNISNSMMTPEKMDAKNDFMMNSGPSPTGERLSQILSGGSSSNFDPTSNSRMQRDMVGFQGQRAGSAGPGMGNQPGVLGNDKGG